MMSVHHALWEAQASPHAPFAHDISSSHPARRCPLWARGAAHNVIGCAGWIFMSKQPGGVSLPCCRIRAPNKSRTFSTGRTGGKGVAGSLFRVAAVPPVVLKVNGKLHHLFGTCPTASSTNSPSCRESKVAGVDGIANPLTTSLTSPSRMSRHYSACISIIPSTTFNI
jgi:hypothetical protein